MAAFLLSEAAVRAGYRVIGHDSVGSTSDEAMAAALKGDEGPLWVAALAQTVGRGRRGRPWQSPHGNLAASLLLVPDADVEALAGLGFVAGLALKGALARVLPAGGVRVGLDGAEGEAAGGRARFTLKWPNDVLADGAKLAGILLEARRCPDGRQAVVLGFGVNVVAAPQGLPYPAVSLAGLGADVAAEAVFAALAESWVECHALWDEGRGLAGVLALWRRSAAGIGAEVAVRRNEGVVRGVFETIDDAGRLIVREEDGRRTAITAGDVHFGAAATLPNQDPIAPGLRR